MMVCYLQHARPRLSYGSRSSLTPAVMKCGTREPDMTRGLSESTELRRSFRSQERHVPRMTFAQAKFPLPWNNKSNQHRAAPYFARRMNQIMCDEDDVPSCMDVPSSTTVALDSLQGRRHQRRQRRHSLLAQRWRETGLCDSYGSLACLQLTRPVSSPSAEGSLNRAVFFPLSAYFGVHCERCKRRSSPREEDSTRRHCFSPRTRH